MYHENLVFVSIWETLLCVKYFEARKQTNKTLFYVLHAKAVA